MTLNSMLTTYKWIEYSDLLYMQQSILLHVYSVLDFYSRMYGPKAGIKRSICASIWTYLVWRRETP
jgi:hypothetical protein